MENINLQQLHLRLKALCVFRALLEDNVIKELCNFLSCTENGDKLAAASAYSEFVSRLYETESADLSLHIKDIVESSENIYMRLCGCGKSPDKYLTAAVTRELETLQLAADITSTQLQKEIDAADFLPHFASSKTDIADSFRHRADNISKYGYGMYARNAAFYIDCENRIVPVKNPDTISLDSLVDYERERNIILENTRALLCGKCAANILLTGDAGTGKSSTVKAVVNELFSEGLRIIEVRKEQLGNIPSILDTLAENPLKFILFIDDLAFRKDDDTFNALKGVLEGSVSAKSKNVVIYATSNRRHIVRERFSDREGDDIHRNDTMQEMISLSERFGIHITFQKPDKATFLRIVHHLAREKNITLDDGELDLLAERFALERGGRSARLARQFVDNLASKI